MGNWILETVDCVLTTKTIFPNFDVEDIPEQTNERTK